MQKCSQMDVQMDLPSPKTPSMKRFFLGDSPKIIQVPRTPRSEGFKKSKTTLSSPVNFTVQSFHTPVTNPVWTSDTPPMTDSSDHVSPNSTTGNTRITISEKRFYSGSNNRKCLLTQFESPALKSSTFREKSVKDNSLKRKRSKSLTGRAHRKRSEPEKLNKNIRHKIKRPKLMTARKLQTPSITENTESLVPPNLPEASSVIEKIDLNNTTQPLTHNLKPKLSAKKISVNVNRMVRVNVHCGEFKFTKHIKSPRKNREKGEKMDLVDETSDVYVDWHDKVNNIIVSLDKENNSPDNASSKNDSGAISPLKDSATHLSDVFCDLGVSELEIGPPAVENSDIFVMAAYKEIDKTPPPESDEMPSLAQEADPTMDDSADKLFPVFYKTHQAKTSCSQKLLSSNSSLKCSLFAKSTDGLEQLIIDAGQKSLGPINCPECGFFYQTGDPDEERMHLKYHNSSKPVIKHTGWKWERVAATFPDGRVVHVCPSDPKPWWVKIDSILENANQDLGIILGSHLSKNSHAYFFVSNMLVLGCVIVEPIRVAYRMLERDRKELERVKVPGEETSIDMPSFCSNTPVRGSRCGINRIWTCPSERRKGIATKMLDAVRATFVYGHILKLGEIAFSDPTPMGMELAMKYTKSSNFLVYKITKD